MRTRGLIAASLLALAFRVALVLSFSCGSADGTQYTHLANSLVRSGVYSFRADGNPPTFARPPGFPIWLSLIARDLLHDGRNIAHRTALWNAILDGITALLVALLARRVLRAAALDERWALAAPLAFAIAPGSFVFGCYVLTEPLATLLTIASLMLVLANDRARTAFAAGFVGGAGMLVRADVVTLLPSLLLACARPGLTTRRARISCVLVGWMLLPSMWMARNEWRFHELAPFGVEWTDASGAPLPTCMVRWFRTWASGARDDEELAGIVYWSSRQPPKLLLKVADSNEELARVHDLFGHLREPGGLARTDEAFCALARERTARAPWRTYLTLPALRITRLLFTPVLRSFPLEVPWLFLPQHRRWASVLNVVFWLIAITGAVLAWRSGARSIASVLFASVLARAVLHAFAVPHLVGPRFFVEAVPIGAICVSLSLCVLGRRLRL